MIIRFFPLISLVLATAMPTPVEARPSIQYGDEDFEWCKFIEETRGKKNPSYLNFCVWNHPGYDNQSPCGGHCDRAGSGEDSRPKGRNQAATDTAMIRSGA